MFFNWLGTREFFGIELPFNAIDILARDRQTCCLLTARGTVSRSANKDNSALGQASSRVTGNVIPNASWAHGEFNFDINLQSLFAL